MLHAVRIIILNCRINISSLAIWNTMMGTSLLSVPWAVKQSGLIASLVIGIGMALIAGYTAVLVIKIHTKYGKYNI